ncbi:MAG: ATP-dependent DNA helicase RecG [Spirochaetes bacterium]|nr:MAG: ATP-dependent DNA helicase RecG [Spirochaetota bacterium]
MFADELKFPVIDLKGIGSSYAKSLAKAGILTVADIIRYAPRSYENRKDIVPLSSVPDKREVNTVVEIVAHDFVGYGKKKTLKIFVRDETSTGVLVCFGRNFLKNKMPVGKRFFLYGQFDYRYGELQSTQFDTEEYGENPGHFGLILPVYPLSGNLKQNVLRKAVKAVLNTYLPSVEDQLPAALIRKYNFPSRKDAVRAVHFPKSMGERHEALRLLKYEELFFLQLTAVRRAFKYKKEKREIRKITGSIMKKAVLLLPFSLTPDQISVLKEIRKDMESENPMYRLLQGDVGSGKTLVAFLAALFIIEAGGQSAFMAPTELLARQHAENAAKLLEPLGVRLAFLSGNIKSKQRGPLLKALKKGEIDLIIGTHALFTSDVEFKKLEFVIVDEQHKFGVMQRISLFNKGEKPDILLMTATPIPRTITMTIFADLDVSVIKTAPEGRKPVITHLSRMGNEEKVYRAVKEELKKGHQAYFVYPRISSESNAKEGLKDAERMFRYLTNDVFPEYRTALIHSKLPDTEKISIMQNFSRGEIKILAATSVVEVGVDVKNATCMVIEHAERFGLSALHQLRGRVGRGPDQAYTFLIYSEDLSDVGKERLKIMMNYSDGFSISEEDLKIRGPGQLAGTRQSGFLKLNFADIIRDTDILNQARKDALSLLKTDPGFLRADNGVLRDVLERCPPFEDDLLSSG